MSCGIIILSLLTFVVLSNARALQITQYHQLREQYDNLKEQIRHIGSSQSNNENKNVYIINDFEQLTWNIKSILERAMTTPTEPSCKYQMETEITRHFLLNLIKERALLINSLMRKEKDFEYKVKNSMVTTSISIEHLSKMLDDKKAFVALKPIKEQLDDAMKNVAALQGVSKYIEVLLHMQLTDLEVIKEKKGEIINEIHQKLYSCK